MNLHEMEFPSVFGETNFVEVPVKFMALKKEHPTVWIGYMFKVMHGMGTK